MEKNNQKVDINDLVVSAGDLESVLTVLNSFVMDRFVDMDIDKNDISALIGLVKAIECLAKEHSNNVESFDGGLENE